MKIYVIIIFILLNLLSWSTFGVDKRKALKNQWRTSEKTLLTLSFFGPFGALLGMKTFHHKTKKIKFKILIPLFLFLQIVLYLLFFYPF
ncbi:DUF1294 domain-containing protein [Defluviitalea raffinosedens]|uniref:DUF1294 domain-containing protein n=1 Tax=Defluviitalea raffinosedens TaxID=1450156 RepID=A0A7C8LH03_9FIRM|nr:DUF1294 domain-containing protein [Defluviitalea raffinosedens]KAE9637336.1 DUF1294 domain-containing protein [Defluviitalea raffinosedens]MBM7685643.1 uncharacterized membrane protein YsdA (DUF1294 family) [Defluviitalea raffinosedens]